MLRTLHITNAWHPTSGGVRTLYSALFDAANRLRRHMTLVVPGEREAISDVGAFGRIYAVPAPHSPLLDRRYRTILPHRFLGRRSTIARIIAREQPDVIEVSDKYTLFHVAGLIKKRAEPRPTLVGLSQERLDDALRAFVSQGPAARMLSRAYLACVYMRQFDAHLANSAYTAAELTAAVDWGGPKWPRLWRLRDRIHVQSPGVDIDRYQPARRSTAMRDAVLRQAGGTPESTLIMFAGRLSSEKHANWLIPAIEPLVRAGRDIRLVVAGDGPLRAALEAQAVGHIPGRVLWLGHQASGRVFSELMASADLFLHPNPREPFGIGPLEAMASGVPVIVPRSGGVLSYATDANAWLADPTPDGLAAAMALALAHPHEMRRRARVGLDTAAAFAWAHMAPQFFETYDTLHAERLERLASRQCSATVTPLIAS